MPLRWLTTLGLMIGLQVAPASARTLQVELDFQHIGGLLPAAELDNMLASAQLRVDATYEPRWLIPGVTARRERTLPIGSKLLPILQQMELTEQQIARHGRTLSFSVNEKNPEHRGYTLATLQLFLPIVAGVGRPQPTLEVILPAVPETGLAQQYGLLSRQGSVELGIRLRYRWSDARGAMQQQTADCDEQVQIIDADHYRFRPSHSHAGLYRELASAVQSDPPSKAVAGQRSLQLIPPLPAELQGWQLSRHHLLQLQAGDTQVERLSLYATREVSAECQRGLSYEALFADGQLVEMEHNHSASGCTDETADNLWLTASWLNDGSLARLLSTQGQAGTRSWEAFTAAQPAACLNPDNPQSHQPEAAQLAMLEQQVASLQRLRRAFLEQ
ncbi:MAG: hypothetical protein KJ989_00790 [Gammaproteobacteria bacterium]|nr:hypothetical protein [Gammaproteobacteria bacterium]MBU2158232.1 hypothetical protein [Gammaproteobacteria bacterium]MBU2257260.1 hypothetical protein [Gammaproteobacteria bacterium]MBU2292721.1 hypothetical protein [Gammaproteobacteria bacterium]